MIEPDAEKRLNIDEVISCIDAITSSKPLAQRRCYPLYAPNRGGLLFPPVSLSESHASRSHVSLRLPERPQAPSFTTDAQFYQAWRDGSFDRNSNVSTDKTQVSSIPVTVRF
jgi:hypothetical protein